MSKISYEEMLGHRQRLRQRFNEKGLNGLQEYEILELILFNVEKTKDVQPVAKALLNRFGSLLGIFSASISELLTVDGVGESIARALYFYSEVHNHLLPLGQHHSYLSRAELILSARKQLETKTYECLSFTAFDRDLRLVYSGETTQHEEHYVDEPKLIELFNNIKRFKGFFVFFVHNHPSRSATPTEDDKDFTKRLVYACHRYHLALLDHAIIGACNSYFSFFYEEEIGNIITEFFMKNPHEMFYTPARLNHFFFPEPHPKGARCYYPLEELLIRSPENRAIPKKQIVTHAEIEKLVDGKYDRICLFDSPYE